jgi:hypothetical protein
VGRQIGPAKLEQKQVGYFVGKEQKHMEAGKADSVMRQICKLECVFAMAPQVGFSPNLF